MLPGLLVLLSLLPDPESAAAQAGSPAATAAGQADAKP